MNAVELYGHDKKCMSVFFTLKRKRRRLWHLLSTSETPTHDLFACAKHPYLHVTRQYYTLFDWRCWACWALFLSHAHPMTVGNQFLGATLVHTVHLNEYLMSLMSPGRTCCPVFVPKTRYIQKGRNISTHPKRDIRHSSTHCGCTDTMTNYS